MEGVPETDEVATETDLSRGAVMKDAAGEVIAQSTYGSADYEEFDGRMPFSD